jgi:hypothetical protein
MNACRRRGEGTQGMSAKILNTDGLKSTLQITRFTTFAAGLNRFALEE